MYQNPPSMTHLIDACDFCGEFHRVTLEDINHEIHLTCERCLDMICERDAYDSVPSNRY